VPITYLKITSKIDSKILYNRISKKEIKLAQETEQPGSIALDNIEVVQKATDDGIVYSPNYIDGQITFEKNNELTDSKYKIAPYLVYTKIGDANISLLDSIARTLSPKAKKSKYGKKFLSLIGSRKK
tara:strand:- start:223 stop:603 length:381 start_codon:yes stop_codon:yes gene_type:complete